MGADLPRRRHRPPWSAHTLRHHLPPRSPPPASGSAASRGTCCAPRCHTTRKRPLPPASLPPAPTCSSRYIAVSVREDANMSCWNSSRGTRLLWRYAAYILGPPTGRIDLEGPDAPSRLHRTSDAAWPPTLRPALPPPPAFSHPPTPGLTAPACGRDLRGSVEHCAPCGCGAVGARDVPMRCRLATPVLPPIHPLPPRPPAARHQRPPTPPPVPVRPSAASSPPPNPPPPTPDRLCRRPLRADRLLRIPLVYEGRRRYAP